MTQSKIREWHRSFEMRVQCHKRIQCEHIITIIITIIKMTTLDTSKPSFFGHCTQINNTIFVANQKNAAAVCFVFVCFALYFLFLFMFLFYKGKQKKVLIFLNQKNKSSCFGPRTDIIFVIHIKYIYNKNKKL